MRWPARTGRGGELKETEAAGFFSSPTSSIEAWPSIPHSFLAEFWPHAGGKVFLYTFSCASRRRCGASGITGISRFSNKQGIPGAPNPLPGRGVIFLTPTVPPTQANIFPLGFRLIARAHFRIPGKCI